jgi:hypothetical protein
MVANRLRRILIDHASERSGPEIARLYDALEQLAGFDSRKAQVWRCDISAGLTADEIGAVPGVSPQSVNRDWSLARAWLCGK